MKETIVGVGVIGGGHAGIEAALAAARLGVDTVMFSMSLDFIGNLPCNPSIGGTAKGHLVREIDALGGEMGKAADSATIQSRMLNRGKGPAVHSLRAQIDRSLYHRNIKSTLENQPNLRIKQEEIISVEFTDNGLATLKTRMGSIYTAKTVILATGTFLRGKIYTGDFEYEGGPDGLTPSNYLSDSLEKLGIELRRFKTGTPARVHSDSIDYSVLEEQPGEEPIIPFSFETKEPIKNQISCYIAYTNPQTHEFIKSNLSRSPLYGGKVEWVGARYCPSIEDKVVRFEGKDRHQIFVEPVGLNTKEIYLQGLSTSLPVELQTKIYRSIKGFERVEIMRNAYAIEYDCIDPLSLKATLEFKAHPGFYSAGQVNGTSGYEEAAAQGLIAGINAAHNVLGKDQLVLSRASSYIGTLIDDLVIKGANEPYRMMTSRSEYRLLLRQDNADVRLTPTGYRLGLISEARNKMFHVKQSMVAREIARLEKAVVPPSKEINQFLLDLGTSEIITGIHIADLIRRPQVGYEELKPFDPQREELPADVKEQVEISLRYAGYIAKQILQVERMKKLEGITLGESFDYSLINGLRIEARQKLASIKPIDLGQASRISGVSPADISVLLIYMEQQRRKGEKND